MYHLIAMSDIRIKLLNTLDYVALDYLLTKGSIRSTVYAMS